MRRDVRACPRCGSDDLRIPGLRDGAMVGEGQELAKWACNACGLMAVPILFDEASRKAFAEEQAKHSSEDWPQSGWPSVSNPFRKVHRFFGGTLPTSHAMAAVSRWKTNGPSGVGPGMISLANETSPGPGIAYGYAGMLSGGSVAVQLTTDDVVTATECTGSANVNVDIVAAHNRSFRVDIDSMTGFGVLEGKVLDIPLDLARVGLHVVPWSDAIAGAQSPVDTLHLCIPT